MLSKTRAIVVKKTKYSDNSLIVKAYTEQFGLQTYLVSAVHGKKSKAALFMPLSLLEIVAQHKDKNKLIRPKEIRLSEPLQSVHSDIRKSSILLFLNEVIYKSIKEEEPNPNMFSFLHDSILLLEYKEKGIANFHFSFLIKLTQFLGFYPGGNYNSNSNYFDLQEGLFSSYKTNYTLDENTSQLLDCCINESFDLINTREIRNNLTDKIVLFYELHIPSFGKIKSVEVLHEINS